VSTIPPRLLILETSGRTGQVALAMGDQLRGVRLLDEARRHARDLAPAVAALLAEQCWKPRDVQAVLVTGWLAARDPSAWVTGPGLRKWAARMPAEVPAVDANQWEPQPSSLLRLGLARYTAGERDDPWTLEPLYLRPSSAEEQWKARPSSAPELG